MSDEYPSAADEKALAMSYAFTALVRSLHQQNALDIDGLFSNLAGARQQLERIGETDAAGYLGALSESLQGIG